MNRNEFAGLFANTETGVDSCFELEDVLHSFDDENIRAAVDESASTQVFLSSAGCPPLSASTPSSAALDQARAQVGGSLRH